MEFSVAPARTDPRRESDALRGESDPIGRCAGADEFPPRRAEAIFRSGSDQIK
jgi:hypothetical protein